MGDTAELGKKVFFLYPPPVLMEVVEELARKEFEVYLVKNHLKLRKLLVDSPNALLFANLDAELDEAAWEAYLRSIREDAATERVGLGVLSLTDDPELKRKYLLELQLPCGFITLKIGAARTAEILLKTLEANEARGRRKYVRAACPPGSASFVLKEDGELLRGEIFDLSAVGMSASFERPEEIRQGSVFREMQLSVRGTRLIVDGIVAARRVEDGTGSPDGRPRYVILFAPSSLDDEKREKLSSLVFKVNQANMEHLLATS